MLSMVFDRDYKILERERKKTKLQDGNGVTVERIIKVIKNSLQASGTNNSAPSGIGIGAPGTLDLAKGVIREAPNLGWKNVPLKELLQKEFSCDVVISNDVDAGVYGEYCFGAAQKGKTVLGIFPGTGIGGGLVFNGQLYTSNNNSCMEIGHFPIVTDGPLCGCGRYGCLEAVASRLAISTTAAAAVYRGEAPALQKIAGTDISEIRSGALAESIKQGDKKIEQIVRNAARYLGKAIGGVINLLAPDTVILGGGLVEAMPEIFLSEIEATAKKFVMPTYEGSYKIKTAKLGDDATAMGAAAWARKIIEKT
ncbi:MAG: ROK family protein [Fibrobacter sp.]|nr:ROK family protein [Fibrobacter sp.]